ncbi:hypothetical protein DZJ_23320 [Dickeya ananatis]
MRTLYRAICFCTDRAESCEKLVFFEVEPSDSPVKKTGNAHDGGMGRDGICNRLLQPQH